MLYEIIANAEDAGASKLAMILDDRDYSEKGTLVSPDMGDQMGPALLVYNSKLALSPLAPRYLLVFADAVFSEKDWQGFKAMGEGSKGHSSTRTIGRKHHILLRLP